MEKPKKDKKVNSKAFKQMIPVGLGLLLFGAIALMMESCYPSRTRHFEFMFRAGCFAFAGAIVTIRVLWVLHRHSSSSSD